MSDKTTEMLEQILKEQKESRDEHRQTFDKINELDKKVDLHIQKTEFELQKINELDQRQNQLIDEHIEGVNTLKSWLSEHEKKDDERFATAAAPKKWMDMTLKVVGALGTLAAAGYGIIKFIGAIL